MATKKDNGAAEQVEPEKVESYTCQNAICGHQATKKPCEYCGYES